MRAVYLAQAKGLPSLIYHEPMLEVRFVRGAAGPTSFLTKRDLLGRIAEQKKATPAQIALAWLLAQKPWIVPIPGTTKLSRLDENNGSLAIKLTSDDLREIDSAASKITVQGDRYPEHLLRMSGR
jgi:diketogulonate reductase-like aldo/keto reductase